MKGFLLVIAYLCIWTTPFQIAFFLWGLGVVFTSEATVLSLTNAAFLSEFLPWFYSWLKPLSYFIFPDVVRSYVVIDVCVVGVLYLDTGNIVMGSTVTDNYVLRLTNVYPCI